MRKERIRKEYKRERDRGERIRKENEKRRDEN